MFQRELNSSVIVLSFWTSLIPRPSHFRAFDKLSPLLHTAGNQKQDDGKAWERGYCWSTSWMHCVTLSWCVEESTSVAVIKSCYQRHQETQWMLRYTINSAMQDQQQWFRMFGSLDQYIEEGGKEQSQVLSLYSDLWKTTMLWWIQLLISKSLNSYLNLMLN